jgi:D-alanine-D-alanine ligase
MKQGARVACLVDDATIPESDVEFRNPPKESSTEYDVIGTLRELGHDVRVVGVAGEVFGVVRELADDRPDVVFNLTEVFRWDRKLDANIAALLELLDIPFTGTSSVGLMLSRNKGLCKYLLNARHIRVPAFAVYAPGQKVRAARDLRFPLVVKPLYSDGSEGISNASLVQNAQELTERVAMIHERFKQPAIAEQFIDGRELYVGLIGNEHIKVLPPRELRFGRAEEGGPVLATYKVKWDKEYREKWQVAFAHAELENKLAAQVSRVCRRAFQILQMRDYGRVDLRIDANGNVYVLEVNPNPNLAKDDEVAESAAKAGIGYAKLIERILGDALGRKKTQ